MFVPVRICSPLFCTALIKRRFNIPRSFILRIIFTENFFFCFILDRNSKLDFILLTVRLHTIDRNVQTKIFAYQIEKPIELNFENRENFLFFHIEIKKNQKLIYMDILYILPITYHRLLESQKIMSFQESPQGFSIINFSASSTAHDQQNLSSMDIGNVLGSIVHCSSSREVDDIPLSEELRSAISNMEDLDDVSFFQIR